MRQDRSGRLNRVIAGRRTGRKDEEHGATVRLCKRDPSKRDQGWQKGEQ